jgi:hypothetical protein
MKDEGGRMKAGSGTGGDTIETGGRMKDEGGRRWHERKR